MFQGCFKGCFKGVSREIQGCLEVVIKMFQVSVEGVLRVFQGCFKVVWRVCRRHVYLWFVNYSNKNLYLKSKFQVEIKRKI